MAVMVTGSALAGAFAFYALFGANFEREPASQSPGAIVRNQLRERGVQEAQAAPVPRPPNATEGTVGAMVGLASSSLSREDGAVVAGSAPRAAASGARGVERPPTALVPTTPTLGTPLPIGARDRASPRSRALAEAAIGLLRSRQPDAARRMIDSVLAMAPTDPEAYALRARANAARGDLRAAWADAEVAERLGDDWQAQTLIASFEARVGEIRAARDRLARLVKRVPPKVPFSAKQGSQLALAYVAIGDTRRALSALLRTRDDGSLAATLKDPGFDRIRGESRFRDILRAVAPDAQ